MALFQQEREQKGSNKENARAPPSHISGKGKVEGGAPGRSLYLNRKKKTGISKNVLLMLDNTPYLLFAVS